MGLINRRDFLAYSAIAAGGAGVNWAMSSGRVKRVRDISHLAQKPPMGWNSFDSYGVYLHEKAAFANAEAMAKKLKPFGYEYFVVDNGWFGEYKMIPGTIYAAEKHASDVKINEYGLLQPSDTYFPNGLKLLIDKSGCLSKYLDISFFHFRFRGQRYNLENFCWFRWNSKQNLCYTGFKPDG